MQVKVSIGPRANNGHPAATVTLSVGRFALKIGAWMYGWANPAYYRRFDHLRIVAHAWYYGSREGDYFYGARGFDKTIVLRENGAWLRLPRLHR